VNVPSVCATQWLPCVDIHLGEAATDRALPASVIAEERRWPSGPAGELSPARPPRRTSDEDEEGEDEEDEDEDEEDDENGDDDEDDDVDDEDDDDEDVDDEDDRYIDDDLDIEEEDDDSPPGRRR